MFGFLSWYMSYISDTKEKMVNANMNKVAKSPKKVLWRSYLLRSRLTLSP
jgi:hypothetical protein